MLYKYALLVEENEEMDLKSVVELADTYKTQSI